MKKKLIKVKIIFKDPVYKNELKRDLESRLQKTANVNLYRVTKFSLFLSFDVYCVEQLFLKVFMRSFSNLTSSQPESNDDR